MPNKSGPAPKAETDQKTPIIGTNVWMYEGATLRKHFRTSIVSHIFIIDKAMKDGACIFQLVYH